jgi:hypothetical protein
MGVQEGTIGYRSASLVNSTAYILLVWKNRQGTVRKCLCSQKAESPSD